MALSMSPSHSTSAFLQSIIPAPVRSRSSLTRAAVILAIISSSSFGRLLRFGGRLSLLALLAFQHGVRHLARDELHRADGVVVARDDIIKLVRIAVGIDDGDYRNTQRARLGS